MFMIYINTTLSYQCYVYKRFTRVFEGTDMSPANAGQEKQIIFAWYDVKFCNKLAKSKLRQTVLEIW